jgi:hypothetical protein
LSHSDKLEKERKPATAKSLCQINGHAYPFYKNHYIIKVENDGYEMDIEM